ncbi:hypothetical protein L7F22_060132 [Adiantum nelumboides]|nr:hypothetical protein [Adiantum nelumboides]
MIAAAMDAFFELQAMITKIECGRLAVLYDRDIRLALLQSIKSRLQESKKPLLLMQHCVALINGEMDEQKSQIQALSSRFSRIQAEAFNLVHCMTMASTTTEEGPALCTAEYGKVDVTLLQRAVDAVSDSLEVCADSLFTMMQEKNISVELQSWEFRKRAFAADEVSLMSSTTTIGSSSSSAITGLRAQDTHSALHPFLSSLVFRGFEDPHVHALPDPYCGHNRPYIFKFEAPQRRKRRFWEEHSLFRDAEARHIVSSNLEFAHFFHMHFTPSLVENLTWIVPPQSRSSIRANILCDDSPFLSSLLQLAKEIWLLHKLVFSFHPITPQLFRVGFASFFDDQYMQPIADAAEVVNATHDKPADQNDGLKRVLAMRLPGFALDNTCLVKAQVWVVNNARM